MKHETQNIKPETCNMKHMLHASRFMFHDREGFTLMETLIYIALFSVITSFVLGVFNQILGSLNQSRDRIEVDAEANFLMQKIRWAMAGVQIVNQPAVNTTSTTLSMTRYNFAQNPVVFDLNSQTMRISKGGASAEILNSSRVNVGELTFEHLPSVNSAPAGVKITLSVVSTDIERPVVASTTITDTVHLR